MGPRSSQAPLAEPSQALGDEAEVVVADPLWRRMVPNVEALTKRAAKAVGGVGAIMLTSDGAVKHLNARHRGRNKPTNVLSFASGELVLAAGVVRREAQAVGRPVAHVLAHLIVHGALHLGGYDHEDAGGARRMELRETHILHRLRVPNPWRRA